jgi:hypothetical protein
MAAPGVTTRAVGGARVVYVNGAASGQALDGVGTGVAGAVDRLRASDPPELIIWGETFEPIDTRSVTLPPRDPRGDRPVSRSRATGRVCR